MYDRQYIIRERDKEKERKRERETDRQTNRQTVITMEIYAYLWNIVILISAYEASGLFSRYGVFWFSKRFMK